MTATNARDDARSVDEIERDFAARMREIYATTPDRTPPVTAIEWDIVRRTRRGVVPRHAHPRNSAGTLSGRRR